jgi:hypothetical protein
VGSDGRCYSIGDIRMMDAKEHDIKERISMTR